LWLAVVVQVAAARKVQRLAAVWQLLRLAGGGSGGIGLRAGGMLKFCFP
jgi:hypothetical protein